MPTPLLPLQQKLSFQSMQPEHLSAVSAIEHTSFPSPRSSELYLRELMHNRLAHYWVIGSATATSGYPLVLAYGGYWLIGDEAHVVVIATHKAWRRRSLGRWLLLEMAAAARMQGALQLTLEVRSGNKAAHAFYLGLGFIEVGLRKHYYTDTGEDAQLMTLFGLDSGAVWRPLAQQLAELRSNFAVECENGETVP